jgi:lysophospholipase L1-like esterase
MNLDKLNARGIINEGNLARFKKVMEKAIKQEPITIGFIGGSITQGSLSSKPTTCYAYKVFEWWEKKFSAKNFTYVNAGIGATTSQFGVARLDSDLLSLEPDVVFLEYSVNDEDTEKFQQTFEGCVRKILSSKKEPALFMFNNVQYDSGVNAQRIHNEIGKYYDLPIVSMKESIYQAIVDGEIVTSDITPDNLHPNDAGHDLVAGVITHLLDNIFDKVTTKDVALKYIIPETYTKNNYGNTVRYNNKNSAPVLQGFVKDEAMQPHITDIFKNGWTANKVGDSITFEFEGDKISVQYRKSIHQPAPIAMAVIDDNQSQAVMLDANFTETWGDKLELQDVFLDGKEGKHTLTITIIEASEELASDFYFAAVIY